MNTDHPTPPGSDQYKSLQILDALSNDNTLTQRDLSNRLGVALGLINSYIKNLASKGFITIKAIPARRYAYYITPKGFAEKTRLTYDLLQDYTRIYREAKSNYRTLFHELEQAGKKTIVFAGADEVAEFAYITLQEIHIKLIDIVDDDFTGKDFFGRQIQPVSSLQHRDHDAVIITSYLRRQKIFQALMDAGIDRKIVFSIFPLEH